MLPKCEADDEYAGKVWHETLLGLPKSWKGENRNTQEA